MRETVDPDDTQRIEFVDPLEGQHQHEEVSRARALVYYDHPRLTVESIALVMKIDPRHLTDAAQLIADIAAMPCTSKTDWTLRKLVKRAKALKGQGE